MKGVYQSKEYKKALLVSGKKLIELNKNFFVIEKEISFLGIKKKTLETRGVPNKEDLTLLKQSSKGYYYGLLSPTLINKNEEILKNQGFIKNTNYTILINLKQTEEELWKNLEKKSIRWGVKTAQKNKLIFEEVNLAKINQFHQIYKNIAKNNFKPEKIEFIQKLANTPISKLFIVKQDSEMLAGGLLLIDKENNYSILDLTASTEKGTKLQAMPFLYWNLILFSKNQGLNYVDLGGYDKEAIEGDKTYNINKFKERFGGEIVEQPIYSTNRKYPLIRALARKIRIIKRIYRKI